MSKRILCLILSAVMVFSLLPVFASAAGEDATQVAEDKEVLTPGEMTTDSMVTNKWLTENGNAYDLTMSAYATGGTMTQELQSDVPLDIVLVLDQSGSMLGADMASTSGYVSAGNKGWTVSDAMGYYVKDGDNYYQLSADRGYTYTSSVHPYLTDSLLGTTGGEDWHTNWETHYPNYYVMDDSGNLCQLYSRSYGYVGGYDCQFYYYPQGSSSAVMIPFNSASGSTTASYSRDFWSGGTGSMDSNSNRLWTTVYKPSSSQTYNHLYYTKDGDGQKVYLGSEVSSTDQTAYTGELFYYSNRNQTRLQALKDAAGQFAETVAERSAATGVDHRISVVGFASNIRASTSTNVSNIVEGSNKYSYVNSGLFFNNTFQSFRKLDYTDSSQFETTSERFDNGVYYCKVNNKFYPLDYAKSTNGSWYWWYLDDSLAWNSYCSSSNASRYTFYEPTFTALTPQQYQSSLVSVYDAGTSNQVNSKINNAIDMLDAYGGTYVSYGIAMANQVFANNSNVITNSDGSTTERKRVVVVFTDGEPGASGYDASVAGEALLDAAALKDTYGASVYTIGLFPGSSSITTQTENFLKQLSSMYFSQSEAVYPEDMDGDKTYYYYDNNEKKTFAVTSDGTVYVWYVSADHGVHKYSLSDYYLYENRGDTTYPQTVYRGRDYWIKISTGYSSYSWQQVHYDYVWYDTDGFIVECNRNPSDTSHTQFYQLSDTVAKDAGDYYFPVSDAGGLTAAFKTISESIQTPYTTVSLNAENSVLRDVITSHFSVNTDKTQNAVTFSLEYSDGDPAVFTAVPSDKQSEAESILTDLRYDWTTNEDGTKTLDVKGFDYSKWFVAEGHPGYKLIATVHGLTTNELGKLYSNESTSGVYKDDSMVAPLPMPYITREVTDTATYVIDFNAPMKLAENAKFQVPVAEIRGKNGVFSKTGEASGTGTVTYKLNAPAIRAENNATVDLNTQYSGVDKALIHGNFVSGTREIDSTTDVMSYPVEDTAAWKEVTVVPATSVYFDDELAAGSALTVGQGYTASLNSSGDVSGAQRMDIPAGENQEASGKTVSFKFTGTRIDVYAKTNAATTYVMATLKDENGNKIADQKAQLVFNGSRTERFNVPTVSITCPGPGTYTLELYALKNANYQLDGIRVYNELQDETVTNLDGTTTTDTSAQDAYKKLDEQNATYTALRGLVLAKEAVPVDGAGEPRDGIGFFTEIAEQKEDGSWSVIGATVDDYQADGPKSEVYLQPGQGLSFTISNWDELTAGDKTPKLMVGLSAPEANNGVVSLSNGDAKQTIAINSPVDMYYPIAPKVSADGKTADVMILNPSSGSGMVSVTNLKVSGTASPVTVAFRAATPAAVAEEPTVEEQFMYVEVNAKTLQYAAHFAELPETDAQTEPPVEEPTPEPTGTPSISDVVRQIISSFIRALFDSVARLFGH